MASDIKNDGSVVIFISRHRGLRVNLECGRKMIDPHTGHFCSLAPVSIKFKECRFATSDTALVEKLKKGSGYKKFYWLKEDAKLLAEREKVTAEKEKSLHKKIVSAEVSGINDGGE